MAALDTLYADMLAFFRPLWPGEDKPLVLGEGKSEAPALMLIGEAPGETEVLKRRPFVGRAGKNLDEFLSLAGLKREEIFVTNVVKIRPVEVGPTGRSRNRAPNREELALFTPWLLREIAQVRPRAAARERRAPSASSRRRPMRNFPGVVPKKCRKSGSSASMISSAAAVSSASSSAELRSARLQ